MTLQLIGHMIAYEHPHRPTMCYHDFAPSSASTPFLTLVRLHGTDYQKTFARNLTWLTFQNFLKLSILILCLTVNSCILSFYLYCTHHLPVMGALEMLRVWVYEYVLAPIIFASLPTLPLQLFLSR